MSNFSTLFLENHGAEPFRCGVCTQLPAADGLRHGAARTQEDPGGHLSARRGRWAEHRGSLRRKELLHPAPDNRHPGAVPRAAMPARAPWTLTGSLACTPASPR